MGLNSEKVLKHIAFGLNSDMAKPFKPNIIVKVAPSEKPKAKRVGNMLSMDFSKAMNLDLGFGFGPPKPKVEPKAESKPLLDLNFGMKLSPEDQIRKEIEFSPERFSYKDEKSGGLTIRSHQEMGAPIYFAKDRAKLFQNLPQGFPTSPLLTI